MALGFVTEVNKPRFAASATVFLGIIAIIASLVTIISRIAGVGIEDISANIVILALCAIVVVNILSIVHYLLEDWEVGSTIVAFFYEGAMWIKYGYIHWINPTLGEITRNNIRREILIKKRKKILRNVRMNQAVKTDNNNVTE